MASSGPTYQPVAGSRGDPKRLDRRLDANHRPDHCDRHVDGRDHALESVLTSLSGCARDRHCAAHAREVYRGVRARLDDLCDIEVKEAQDGDRVIAGRALIAPGGRHLQFDELGLSITLEVNRRPGCEPTSALGRCVVPFSGESGWTQRAGRHHDRYG